ncbi:THAP domain-containing protein 11-like isoform X2 [Amblyomma americanum]
MSEAQPRALKRRGDRYCCVVDCHNSKANTKDREPPVKFYRFPGRWYEKERRQAWTAAVRRVNPDGSEWLPTTATRICSDHFVGNCRSEISSHPSYIPTIFPPVYRKKAANQNREGRHARQSLCLQGILLCFSQQQTGRKRPLRFLTQTKAIRTL